jgi:hypothetical protein
VDARDKRGHDRGGTSVGWAETTRTRKRHFPEAIETLGSSDGHGGTAITDPTLLGGVAPLVTSPHP